MKNLEKISRGISGFMKYWKKLSNEDFTGEYRRHYKNLWYYWHVVKDVLDLPIQLLLSLQDGFWLESRIASVHEDEFIEDGNVCKEYNEDDHFVGQRQDRLAPSFRVLRDVCEDYFVAVWLSDGDSHPVWIVQAKSDPNCLLIQYFQPMLRSQLAQDTYYSWDSETGLHWKIEELNGPQWEHTDSIITAWKSKV